MDVRGMMLAFLYIGLASVCECRIFFNEIRVLRNSHSADSVALTDKSFGFLPGGRVIFWMDCTTQEFSGDGVPDIWLLFCSTADGRQFLRMNTNQLNFDCVRLDPNADFTRTDAFCQRDRVPHNTSGLSNFSYFFSRYMKTDFFYKFVLLQCPHYSSSKFRSSAAQSATSQHAGNSVNNLTHAIIPIKCHAELSLRNPGEEHLSSDEIPMPLIYCTFMFFWAVLSTAWLVNFAIYHKYSNRLHKFLSLAPIFKVLLITVILLRWEDISNTGIESVHVLSLRHFVQSVADALLFLTMMVVAEGWGVVHYNVKHYRWTSLLLMFVVFAVSLMCVHWVHNYFLAFSVCCVVFMMYKTLKWCSYNIELLQRRRRKTRHFVSRCQLRFRHDITLEKQFCEKLQIYVRFRLITAAFSMVYAIVITLATFLSEFTYVQALTYELPQLFIYSSIGFIFRLRNFHDFENIEVVVPRENCAVLLLPDCCHSSVEPNVVLGIPCSSSSASWQGKDRDKLRHFPDA